MEMRAKELGALGFPHTHTHTKNILMIVIATESTDIIELVLLEIAEPKELVVIIYCYTSPKVILSLYCCCLYVG